MGVSPHQPPPVPLGDHRTVKTLQLKFALAKIADSLRKQDEDGHLKITKLPLEILIELSFYSVWGYNIT